MHPLDRRSFDENVSLSLSLASALFPVGSSVRGAYQTCGILVADLLLNQPGVEVIIGSLSGDLIVMNESLTTEYFRTVVPGSIGAHNSLRVMDSNDDGLPELYAGGSFGLWRFVTPSEGQTP